MNKDTDIKYLIEQYKNLKNEEKEAEESYIIAKKSVIGRIVNITNEDHDKCEYMLDDEPEIILGLLRNIDKNLIEDYSIKLYKYNDIVDKIISVNTRLIMILVQITKYKFDKCRDYFKYDIDVSMKLLEYIDKLEKGGKNGS